MGRRLFRQSRGRFRAAALADFGMACCEKCGSIFTPKIPEGPGVGPSAVDPREVWAAHRFCADCGGNPASESTGLVADGGHPGEGGLNR